MRPLSQTAVFTHLVRDHMGAAPVVVPAGISCAEALARLRASQASVVVVTDARGRPIGIVTERDIARRVAFAVDASTPVDAVMSAPVVSVFDSDYLFHAIARMRRRALRHMPVADRGGRVVGVIQLHQAMAVAGSQMMRHVDCLTHEGTLEGLKGTKAAQVDVADELFRDTVPTPEIQRLLTRINNDLYRRVADLCLAEMASDGRGDPPVPFDVVVMGSGGRGESYLAPDQDNGFVIADYPDAEHDRIDAWFIGLAQRMTRDLDTVGIEYCKGHVMATNPLWRKNLSQWKRQIGGWVGASEGMVLRLSDIFFDFVCVHGDSELTAQLREHVTRLAPRPFFLRGMFRMDEDHRVALGLFDRLLTDREEGPHRGELNLKMAGTLPLVGAVRLLALREQVAETSTLGRIVALEAAGAIPGDEADYLRGAFEHVTNLLLREQVKDFKTGAAVGNHVPLESLSSRERHMLVAGFKAIRRFRERVRAELTAEIL